MTNLLDERIDYRQSMDRTYRHRVVRTLFRGAQSVSYTHLDVYKRQAPTNLANLEATR